VGNAEDNLLADPWPPKWLNIHSGFRCEPLAKVHKRFRFKHDVTHRHPTLSLIHPHFCVLASESRLNHSNVFNSNLCSITYICESTYGMIHLWTTTQCINESIMQSRSHRRGGNLFAGQELHPQRPTPCTLFSNKPIVDTSRRFPRPNSSDTPAKRQGRSTKKKVAPGNFVWRTRDASPPLRVCTQQQGAGAEAGG